MRLRSSTALSLSNSGIGIPLGSEVWFRSARGHPVSRCAERSMCSMPIAGYPRQDECFRFCGRTLMPQHSGTFTGTLVSTSNIVVPDIEQHKLELTIIAGSHRSEDPLWNGLWMTYYGVSDLVNDQGKAQG